MAEKKGLLDRLVEESVDRIVEGRVTHLKSINLFGNVTVKPEQLNG